MAALPAEPGWLTLSRSRTQNSRTLSLTLLRILTNPNANPHQGCELRLTTVLRGGGERLKADFDASLTNQQGPGDASLGPAGDFCAFAGLRVANPNP